MGLVGGRRVCKHAGLCCAARRRAVLCCAAEMVRYAGLHAHLKAPQPQLVRSW